MKLASIFGRYDEEWNDGDWWKANGEVPAIITLENSQWSPMERMPQASMLEEAIQLSTYSSRTQLPAEMPPQLMPVRKLPAALSLRGMSFIEMGLAPVP